MVTELLLQLCFKIEDVMVGDKILQTYHIVGNAQEELYRNDITFLWGRAKSRVK